MVVQECFIDTFFCFWQNNFVGLTNTNSTSIETRGLPSPEILDKMFRLNTLIV